MVFKLGERLGPLVLALALGVTAGCFSKPKPGEPLLQLEIPAPEGASFGPVRGGAVQVSPDGRRLVFVAEGKSAPAAPRGQPGSRMLWLQALGDKDSAPLAGTEDAALPFWSADSRSVAFSAGGKLQKVDVTGGRPQVICEMGAALPGTWNSEGIILFGLLDGPIHRVPAAGGAPSPVFSLDLDRRETGQVGPYFLPGGKLFLYYSIAEKSGVMLGSLDGKTRRFLFPHNSLASYVSNPAGGGWILYLAGGQLMARPFDASSARFTGEPVEVADSLAAGPNWSASANGVLAFRHDRTGQSRLTWFTRDGKQSGVVKVRANPSSYPRISPDQKTIVFSRHVDDPAGTDLWLFDIARGAPTRFTLRAANDAGYDDFPLWSPDGSRILFYSRARGARGALVERAADGSNAETILLKSDGITGYTPTSASRDGRWLAVSEITRRGHNIILLSRVDGRIVRVNDNQSYETLDGSISPDGRWLLYTASATASTRVTAGAGRQVFVRPLPKEAGGPDGAVGRIQISRAGGANPAWRNDGEEIFYLAADGKMMAVPVESGTKAFHAGIPKPLFQTGMPQNVRTDYDVTSDGQRFLLNIPWRNPADDPITVIFNWPKLLEK